MKCYRKNGSDEDGTGRFNVKAFPSMKCYRKNGSDFALLATRHDAEDPSMKCYRKNGSDAWESQGQDHDQSPQ